MIIPEFQFQGAQAFDRLDLTEAGHLLMITIKTSPRSMQQSACHTGDLQI
jgi:hypothetical protein